MTTVLVTGAAGGMGTAIVQELRSAGHRVLTQDVRSTEQFTPDVEGNLLERDVLDRLSRLCAEQQVGAVIAAHGIAGAAPVRDSDLPFIERLMGINTLSVIALYHALEDQLQATEGTFVGISSQAGLVAEANNGVYCASKFALIGWAQAIAQGSGAIRVRMLCPGATDTPLLVKSLQGQADARGITYEEILAERNAQTPAGRLGKASDMARASRFLMELREPRLLVSPVTGGEVLY